MTKAEIEKKLENVIDQQRAFYSRNPYLKLSKAEAKEKLNTIIGAVCHVGLFLLTCEGPEYSNLIKYAYEDYKPEEITEETARTEDQISIFEMLDKFGG